MMDPTHEPQRMPDGPTGTGAVLSDDAVVAYLRAGAPGLPTARLDPRAVTSRARRALRRHRRRSSAWAVAGVAIAYLALAMVGPLPVPGVGAVSVPGGSAVRGLVGRIVCCQPPGPGQWPADVDRLQREVLPVVDGLNVFTYIAGPPCRVLEYPRGSYRDGGQECQDLVPFDARARADFDQVTVAVERSGVAVERIVRVGVTTYVQLKDNSWQYNWEYAYLPGISSPTGGSRGEEWTHIRGDWWFHRTFDD